MLFIISHHFFGHGGWSNVTGGANSFFMDLTSALFVPSVNIFVMISAYFMCTHDTLSVPWKKLLKLYVPVYFYSAVLYIIFTATGVYKFDVHSLIATLFPVLMGKYWFVSAYFVMMIASPFLNLIVKHLSKAQFSMTCLAIIAFAALKDVGVTDSALVLSSGYNGLWFCLLYILAAYIRKYDIRFTSKMAFAICAICFVGVVMLMTFVWKHAHYTSIVTIYMSIFIFLAAKTVTVSGKFISKIICSLSRLTFGVYLIHDSNEMRGWMYENLFHSSQLIPSKLSFLIYIGFILLTFTICAAIEFVRQLGFSGISYLIRRLFGEKIDSINARIKTVANKIADKINSVDASQSS